jgi:soluble lytic murein transglycosylase-like protein
MSNDYSAEVQIAAGRFGLEPDLVRAVISKESGGKTHAYRFEASVAEWFRSNPKAAGLIPRATRRVTG